MYLVLNVSTDDIFINDLNINLSSKQAIDLHKINLKKNPYQSQELNKYIKQKRLKVLYKDNKGFQIQQSPQPKKQKKEELDLNQIRQIIREEMAEKSLSQPQPQSNQSEELKEIMNLLKGVVANSSDKNIHMDNDDSVDKIDSIHAKAVKKMMDGVKGSIKSQDQKVKNSISKNLSELEELL